MRTSICFFLSIGLFALATGCGELAPDGAAIDDLDAGYESHQAMAQAEDSIEFDSDELEALASTNNCSTSVTVNGVKQKERCSINGNNADCKCKENGVLVDTCSGPAADACSIPGGCCGF